MVSGTISDAPKVFTTEAWFKTSTTQGGKIIGFGNQSPGTNSGSYDRHVYMDQCRSARLRGLPGQRADDHLDRGLQQQPVASRGRVARPVGHGPLRRRRQRGQPIRRDHRRRPTWATGGSAATPWAAGRQRRPARTSPATIDDVAVYPRVLIRAGGAEPLRRGQGQVTNDRPTADFTFSDRQPGRGVRRRRIHRQRRHDHRVRWDFGDGQAAPPRPPDHSYAASAPTRSRSR